MESRRDNVYHDTIPVNQFHSGQPNVFVTFIEQYVKYVNNLSSQYESSNSIYRQACQIVGNPGGDLEIDDQRPAFVMRTYGQWQEQAPSYVNSIPQNNGAYISHDYIDLEFHEEVFPIRVSVFETHSTGSVVAVWARDRTGQWHELWSGRPQKDSRGPRIFSPLLKFCSVKTNLLRLELNHSLLNDFTHLHAVRLVGTSELILPRVDFKDRSLSALLWEIGYFCNYERQWDLNNSTPDPFRANADIDELKNSFHKYCELYKSLGLEAPTDSLRTLFTSCTSLEKVFLHGQQGLSDHNIEPLLHCSQLQQLDLFCTRILTPDICFRLLLSCPRLRLMELTWCAAASDTNVKEWRERFKHVFIKKPSPRILS